ncbi:MAG: hypothetical protein AAGC63_01660 [Propionicimonas sp.]|nr:hypothetical protein [Propionicimonas sp.]
MALFSGPRPDRDLLDSLTAQLGRRPRVLAWAATDDGYVVGLADRMLVRDASGWQAYPWHRIATGKWDGGSSLLVWVDTDGCEHTVALSAPALFPDLFNERVSASVVFARRVDLGDGRHATIALRRNLAGGTDEADWQVTPSPGVDLDEPAVSARIDQELAAVQSDFGIA